MAQCTLKPDIDFTRTLAEAGGDSLKKCYQCATCAVACPMSPANAPYPRKEMVWASWGLKDKLTSDVDIWLCHNCGNCSDLCPRGANPADVMSAARNAVYQDLTEPKCVGKLMRNISGLPILFAIPAILWFVVWWIRSAYNDGNWFPTRADGSIVFGDIFYGDYTIDPIFIITFFGALLIICRGAYKLWQSFKPEGSIAFVGEKGCWLCHLWNVLVDEVIFATHFDDCHDGPKTGKAAPSRRVGHTVLVWAFCILAFVTAVVALGHWGGKIFPAIEVVTPLKPLNLIKIIANVGALMLVVGLIMLTIRRFTENSETHKSNYYDWYLLGIIWAIALTGIFSQVFRLAEAAGPAFLVYYLHLVFVWMLFAYLPWSKLGHFVYRTVALLYVRMYGRKA
ncbi:MAG: quinone-interacting membrane-bound oxidoreductase complex subunit QmoC [Desulfovibrionaceae bacterium]|nr:quinone-interacting membrane-bound oxidoreductase complex subunit QmoC [Desulfovibrionaceae bacterium]